MSAVIVLVFLAPAIWSVVHGIKLRSPWPMVVGLPICFFTLALFRALGWWGVISWFSSLQYNQPLWAQIITKLGTAVISCLFSVSVVFSLTHSIRKEIRIFRLAAIIVSGCLGVAWGFTHWDVT